MARKGWMAVGVLSILVLATGASATTYSGSLQYTPGPPPGSGDGLYVDGPANQWTDYTITFSWSVSDGHTAYPGYEWKYEYRMVLSGTAYKYSHIIVEASSGLTTSDIKGLSNASLHSITTQFSGPGNPGMPEDLYGIKFDPLADTTDWSWSFYSLGPTWGDFYGRCGGKQGGINHAYNYNLTGGVAKGFLDPDADDENRDDPDPTVGPSSGSVDYHILVPTPEPATVALLAAGVGAVLAKRRRR